MDDLERALTKVAERLRKGQWGNETRVRRSLIDPVLSDVGWDVEDQEECELEYPVGRGKDKGKVDYALLGNGKPQVFVEAKKMGGIDVHAEEQLFRYGYYAGVQFLVLTDGDQWDFYLNTAEGRPDERRFCRLSLKDSDKIPDHADFLKRHLWKDRVLSGEARRNAKELHEREKARRAIPEVLKDLLQQPGEMLLGHLADRVEKECGIRPKTADIEEYLKGVIVPEAPVIVPEAPRTPEPRRATPPPASPAPAARKTGEMRKAYWAALNATLNEEGGPVRGNRKPQPDPWMAYPVGRTDFGLNPAMVRRQKTIRTELYIQGRNAKRYFKLLEQQRAEIEQEAGFPLEWQELPEGQNCRIAHSLDDVDPFDKGDWPRQHEWLAKHLNAMYRAFFQRIRDLPRRPVRNDEDG